MAGRSGHAGRVAVIGIGLGGMVSCRAALGGAPINDLVLWSVPARGRTLLRELRAFSALEAANIPVAGEPPRSDPRDEGTVVANGYLLSAETVQELEHLDLQEVEASSRASRRALLLGRDGLKVDGALLGALESAGAAVTVADVQGYGAMMPSEPHEARAPTEVFEFVGSWLGEGEPRGASVVTAEHRQTGTGRDGTGTGEDGDILTPGVPRDHDEIVIRRSGVALRERPILFDGPGGRLFGVLTEPLGIRRELTGVLPNAGFQRRTGPNRMWVEIARRWAVNGVPTLRLDGAGIGDFEGDVTTPGQIAEFYKPLYVEQACAALEMLAERGLPSRFVMLGFCSGAYCSAHAALADERVSVVCMINPRTLIFDEWQWRYTLRHIRHIRESMLLPSTWRRVLRGQIRLDKHFATGRTLVGRAASVSIRARERNVSRRSATREASEPAAREPVADLFDALRDRDQRALLMFTGKEALHRELQSKGCVRRSGSLAEPRAGAPRDLRRHAHARPAVAAAAGSRARRSSPRGRARAFALRRSPSHHLALSSATSSPSPTCRRNARGIEKLRNMRASRPTMLATRRSDVALGGACEPCPELVNAHPQAA